MWQKLMILLARNEKMKLFFQSRRKLIHLSTKFVGGQNEEEAIHKSIDLMNHKVTTSMFLLGEYERDLEVIERSVNSLTRMCDLVLDYNLDIHISIDPTQVGLQIDKTLCFKKLKLLANKIKANKLLHKRLSNKSFLMIDMEDSTVCNETINFYNELEKDELPVAITLQAYLYRTEDDLKRLIMKKAAVRLVKGAFVEKKDIAFTKKRDINMAYKRLVDLMLSENAKENGFYPVFATHDDKMIDYINAKARENSWKKEQYEFEMLYGVRVSYQKELIRNNYKLRLYLPYGKDWWPYAIRRVGEKPKNLKYILKN